MYTPTSGIFVNGNIADGPDILNEFGMVASELAKVSQQATREAQQAEQNAKLYSDSKLDALVIDGGTF